MNGFGTPEAVYLLYVVKLVVFALGGVPADLGDDPGPRRPRRLRATGGREPIVFQKVVVWLVLWEVIGLGCGSMPLTFRFLPPIGGILYWLRPGTVRLPPWPDKVPLTARHHAHADRRRCSTPACSASGVYLLLSDGEPAAGTAAGRLDPAAVAVLLGFLGAARAARQGRVPRRAPGGLRAAADHLPVPAHQPDRRRPDRLPLHLARRGERRSSTATSRSWSR